MNTLFDHDARRGTKTLDIQKGSPVTNFRSKKDHLIVEHINEGKTKT